MTKYSRTPHDQCLQGSMTSRVTPARDLSSSSFVDKNSVFHQCRFSANRETLAVRVRAVAAASAVTNRLLTVVPMSIQHWAALGKHIGETLAAGKSDRPIIETNSRLKSMSSKT